MIIIALILFIASRYADIWSSRRGIYYGLHETNKLFRDKYNVFSLWKYVVINAGLGAAITILALNVQYGWATFLPFAAFSFFIAWQNTHKANINREIQIRDLQTLARYMANAADRATILSFFNDKTLVPVNGRTYYQYFNWIYEDGPAEQVADKLVDRLCELSTRPETEWFPA